MQQFFLFSIDAVILFRTVDGKDKKNKKKGLF